MPAMPDFLNIEGLGIMILAGIILLLSIGLFRRPIKMLFRLVVNTIGGLIVLVVINFLGQFVGISLGLTGLNAIIVGIFGLPGVGFLLIFQWLLA